MGALRKSALTPHCEFCDFSHRSAHTAARGGAGKGVAYFGAEPTVRIHLPPVGSLRTFGPSAADERGPENLNNRAAVNCIDTYRAPPEPSGGAAYHRAAATRARRLREEATTRPIAQHEQIAEEIERATEVRPNKEPAEDETGVV